MINKCTCFENCVCPEDEGPKRREFLPFRDHTDLGEPVNSVLEAIGVAARAHPDRYNYESMHEAVMYLWTYVYSPWEIEVENGWRLLACEAVYMNESGRPKERER